VQLLVLYQLMWVRHEQVAGGAEVRTLPRRASGDDSALLPQRREVRMRQAVAEHDLGIKMRGVAAVLKADEDVGVLTRRANELLGIAIAAVELAQHLIGCVRW
jgi:hypothetical protein